MQRAAFESLGAEHPLLCLVTDASVLGRALEAGSLEAWLAAGIDWVQVRDRAASALRLYEIARAVEQAIARVDRPAARLIVNRRVDVAIAAHAGGVHLGFDALEPDAAGSLLPPDALTGVSTHTLAEVADARARGADYVHLAPIYDPLSKASERPALGLEPLKQACALGIPVIAQGGITPACCADIVRAGAAGIAVTGAIAGSSDPPAAASALRAALDAVA